MKELLSLSEPSEAHSSPGPSTIPAPSPETSSRGSRPKHRRRSPARDRPHVAPVLTRRHKHYSHHKTFSHKTPGWDVNPSTSISSRSKHPKAPSHRWVIHLTSSNASTSSSTSSRGTRDKPHKPKHVPPSLPPPIPAEPRPHLSPNHTGKSIMPPKTKEAFWQLSQSLAGFYETLEASFKMTNQPSTSSREPSVRLSREPSVEPPSPVPDRPHSPVTKQDTPVDSTSPPTSPSSSTGFPSDPQEQPQEPYSPPEDLSYPRFLEKPGTILHLDVQKE
ncbi:vegetative cell wall protein gp1-like [Rhinatrema bivittatum]|uniref:vegetative cell wall protein gp1-like n=1 Tax=Rhinatrema bivittatum TaxID=194408 RepID=UPI00112AB961|nr:vegetative cell wall protein gp1-like [Rhinatrema bivittatum]